MGAGWLCRILPCSRFWFAAVSPATLAGGLTARQIWWLATVLATAFGLYALIFGKSPIFKAAGVAVLALPHLIGASTTFGWGGADRTECPIRRCLTCHHGHILGGVGRVKRVAVCKAECQQWQVDWF